MSGGEQNGDESVEHNWPTNLSTLPEEFIVCFWANTEPRDEFTGCTDWRGQYDDEGQPIMHYKGRPVSAVRIAMADVGMPVYEPGMVLKKCRNSRCVDPWHVRWAYEN